MAQLRRASRELALKALFQMDVGKQPLEESLELAIDQASHILTSAVGQAANAGAEEVLGVVRDSEADLSQQSRRQLRAAGRAIAAELRSLEELAAKRLGESVREAVVPDESEVIARFVKDASGVAEAIRGHASRPTLHPHLMSALATRGVEGVERAQDVFVKVIEAALSVGGYAVRLIRGASEMHAEIDRQVAALASGWSLDRQAAVDRNILRLAAYELLYEPEVTAGIAINEAVELARKYSTEESGRFVNGVLGALASQGLNAAASGS